MIATWLRRLRCRLRGGHRFRMFGWNGSITEQRIVWRCECGQYSWSSKRGFFPETLRPWRQ